MIATQLLYAKAIQLGELHRSRIADGTAASNVTCAWARVSAWRLHVMIHTAVHVAVHMDMDMGMPCGNGHLDEMVQRALADR